MIEYIVEQNKYNISKGKDILFQKEDKIIVHRTNKIRDRINIQTQQGKIEIFDNYYLLTSASIHIQHLTTVCINALDNKYLNKRFDNFASMTKNTLLV